MGEALDKKVRFTPDFLLPSVTPGVSPEFFAPAAALRCLAPKGQAKTACRRLHGQEDDRGTEGLTGYGRSRLRAAAGRRAAQGAALGARGRRTHQSRRQPLPRLRGQGVWAVEASVRDRSYSVYVDPATGELIGAYDFHRNGVCTPAQDDDALRIASAIDQLDAEALVASLIAPARQTYPSYYDAAKQDAWREETRRKYKVMPIYDAKNRAPAPESFDDLAGDGHGRLFSKRRFFNSGVVPIAVAATSGMTM